MLEWPRCRLGCGLLVGVGFGYAMVYELWYGCRCPIPLLALQGRGEGVKSNTASRRPLKIILWRHGPRVPTRPRIAEPRGRGLSWPSSVRHSFIASFAAIAVRCSRRPGVGLRRHRHHEEYYRLITAGSHMLVSKIKPCMWLIGREREAATTSKEGGGSANYPIDGGGEQAAKAFAKDVFINQERKLGARRRSDTVLV
ncbi:hypothetical protein FNV43_RR20954 [Rhamnella rubrinervis]|uniref:Uncharacterized protein n=1 Tax=Rhamnella rubrinervis TaxID=2594499 RepID=A0A8K0E1Q8_9ROSA|nr:hypothetical protein FNV43_RR20954 [Rhamnella rubrinervis]